MKEEMFEEIKESSEIITNEVQQEYWVSKYLVTTVIPYVTDPKINTYKLGKEDLDEFLEGYDQCSEYLVSIVKVDNEIL